MVREDEFSYENLKSMWSRRDNYKRPLKINPPTARDPLRLSAKSESPERRRRTASRNTKYQSQSTPKLMVTSTLTSDKPDVDEYSYNATPDNDDSGSKNNNSQEAPMFREEKYHGNKENKNHGFGDDLDFSGEFSGSGSYEEDITCNLMKTNANDLSNSSVEGSFDAQMQPKRLWQQSGDDEDDDDDHHDDHDDDHDDNDDRNNSDAEEDADVWSVQSYESAIQSHSDSDGEESDPEHHANERAHHEAAPSPAPGVEPQVVRELEDTDKSTINPFEGLHLNAYKGIDPYEKDFDSMSTAGSQENFFIMIVV